MNKVTLLSVDLAKDVFQIAGFTDRLKVGNRGHPLDFSCQPPVRIFSQLNGQEYNYVVSVRPSPSTKANESEEP